VSSITIAKQAGAVVLAAGRGLRFGSGKLTASFRGRPLIAYVLDVVTSASRSGLVAETFVVVPKGEESLNSLVRRAGLDPVPNDNPELGISWSLRLGLAALIGLREERLGAAIILLGDQPLVRLDTLAALIQGWREGQGSMLRPRYAAAPQLPGHPVLLDRSLWHLAETITGDRGLGTLLRPDDPGVVLLNVPGENPDIDTAADLRALEGLNP
jgi:CTP:molybdopterin cytidylyltransferase MocA